MRNLSDCPFLVPVSHVSDAPNLFKVSLQALLSTLHYPPLLFHRTVSRQDN